MVLIDPEFSRFAATTFFAKSHPGDVCGSNGLPLTPNSIAILGRFQRLKVITHKNLCRYLDIIRGKHERLIVVSEYFGTTLQSCDASKLSTKKILHIFCQVAKALDHLKTYKIVTHNLEPKHILVDEYIVQLFNYGMSYMTNGGQYVPFPIGNIKYMPPEYLLGQKNNIKSDVWSLGIIIAELLLQCTLWSNLNISSILRKIFSLCSATNVFEKIARQHNCLELYQKLDEDVRNAVEKCLAVKPCDRPFPAELLKLRIFDVNARTVNNFPSRFYFVNFMLYTPSDQMYYWWQLAGGDVQADLKREGLIRSEAPILAVPQVVSMNGVLIGPKRKQSHLMDDRVVPLKLQKLLGRLQMLSVTDLYPSIYYSGVSHAYRMNQLPLIIKETDVEYQVCRVLYFDMLLRGFPSTSHLIREEAAIDIPPFLRGRIWACLLDVIPNGSYEKIDKYTATCTDRQIDVDIPRCHQYDDLLSSPEGHRKLKRLLKAWVTAHPQYVYWQGLDSLTAPFLYLNFNDEELAFLSIYKFIPKYLEGFFLKDNSVVIKEYLCKFSQLTAFHEPVLAQHMATINFIPELFAIPWFLTMFSHVFPLHKILHLWDKLILGDSSFPLYIGIAILKQLKLTLLESGFNECILLFSDLPDIIMETCAVDSQKMYEFTPKSLAHRQHVVTETEIGPFDISNDIALKDLQNEMCPRISANDFKNLLASNPDGMVIIDLRSTSDYNRIHLPHSINMPYQTLDLSTKSLEALNTPLQFEESKLQDKLIVCISNTHQHAVEFSKFLVECGVSYVCVLHNGFHILHTIEPNILISN